MAGEQRGTPTIAAALALAVGVLCVLGWVARLGFLANLLSRPVLVGYMAGIAVLMIVSQLGKVTGIAIEGELGGRASCARLATQLDQVHLADPAARRRASWCCCSLGQPLARRASPDR